MAAGDGGLSMGRLSARQGACGDGTSEQREQTQQGESVCGLHGGGWEEEGNRR